MNFLPTDYEAPKTSNFYMRLQDGDNKVRILSRPVIGWEDWTEDKKPVRFRLDQKPDRSIDPKKPVKHFWAFIVFNYLDHKIQIYHVTQATIRNAIEALSKDADWGAPFLYDIKINKSGEGKNTEYVVNPVPHKTIEPYIVDMFKDTPIYLDALFESEDPFAKHWNKHTPFGLDEKLEEVKTTAKLSTITQEQALELTNIFKNCDDAYIAKLWMTLGKPPIGIKTISDLPCNLYDRIKSAALNNKKKVEEIPGDFDFAYEDTKEKVG